MHYEVMSFWGMHFIWWLIWIAAMVVLFTPIAPVSITRRRETALEVLQRRYATGELTTESYAERKAVIERDSKPSK